MAVPVVLLALLLFILFAPLRYAADIAGHGRLNARIKISWGFALFSLRVRIADTGTEIVLRVAGFRIRKKAGTGGKKPPKKPKAPGARHRLRRSRAEENKAAPERTFTERISKMVTLLTETDVKTIIALLGCCLTRIIRAVLPKHLQLDATVGFSDPALTGWLFGAYAAAGRLRRRLRLTADFTGPVLHIDGNIRGSFCAAGLLWPLLRFIASRPVRGLIARHLGIGNRNADARDVRAAV